MTGRVRVTGWGQVTQPKAQAEALLDPLGLMAEAARRAGDARGSREVLGRLDAVLVVKPMSRSYAVVYARDGSSAYAVVYGRTRAGRRFVARTPPRAEVFAELTAANQVGRTVHLRPDPRAGGTIADLG